MSQLSLGETIAVAIGGVFAIAVIIATIIVGVVCGTKSEPPDHGY